MSGHLPAPDHQVRSLLDAGQFDAANLKFDELIATAPNLVTENWNPATVLVHRALLAWRLERIPLALELAAEGWTALDAERPSSVASAHTASMLGYLLETIGHRAPALDLLTLAVRAARDAGDASTLAHCLTREGDARVARALRADEKGYVQFRKARGLFDEALDLASPGTIRRTALAGAARTRAGMGELEEADRLGLEALHLAARAEDWLNRALSNSALAAVSRARGDPLRARTLASRALDAAERVRDTALVMRFSRTLAAICTELADPVGQAAALRRTAAASENAVELLQEGLGQALEQRRVAVQAQRMAQAAREAAARDPLTGLYNRLGLERRGRDFLRETADAGHVPWLLLIDVDWFKDVNDRAGHSAGDMALQEVAQLLQRECRDSDVLCRWAGDEFVVLLADTAKIPAETPTEAPDSAGKGAEFTAGPLVAERIRSAVDSYDWRLALGRDTAPPTVSIGVVEGPGTLDELFTTADIALYRAKNAGRNRVEIDRNQHTANQP